jgi:N-acetylneuraminic acid mutarotase
MKNLNWILLSMMALTSCATPTSPSVQIMETSVVTLEPTVEVPSETPSTPWIQKQNMPSARSEMPAVELDGLIYVVGGFGPVRGGLANGYDAVDTFEAYDPKADQWISLAPTPEPRNHSMIAAHQGKSYVFGGYVGVWQIQQNVWMYDPPTDTWTVLNPMPASRAAGAAVTVDDAIYLIGGNTSKAGVILPTWRYDPLNDTWQDVAPLQQPREHVSAVTIDGLIYVLGGRWITTFNSVEIYDPMKDEWTPGISMKDSRAGFGATVMNGKIYVAGGELIDVGKTVKSVEVFDPDTKTWSSLPDLPNGLHGFPMVGAENMNMLYVIGGSNRAADVINWGRVFAYQP